MTLNLDEVVFNNKFNIVDVLRMDHRYLKECTKIIRSENSDNKMKLSYARSFLDTLYKHSLAEKKVVYAPLEKIDNLKKFIIEGEVKHDIIDTKIKKLIPQIAVVRTLNDQLLIELKVVAELLDQHLKEEEGDIFPLMKKDLDKTILNEMGFQFMKLRGFTAKDLKHYPMLQREVSGLKKLGHRLSAGFLSRVEQHKTRAAHTR